MIKEILKVLGPDISIELDFKKDLPWDKSACSFSGCTFASEVWREVVPKITVGLAGRKNRYQIYHTFLHECCHAKINPTWYKPERYYLVEYKAEKYLRKLCRKYDWDSILNESDRWVADMYRNSSMVRRRAWLPYVYAAKRIKREEKLQLR